jgi:hypothetical protein
LIPHKFPYDYDRLGREGLRVVAVVVTSARSSSADRCAPSCRDPGLEIYHDG